ncbi:trypsin-like serine peptidase [Streptomyces bambusae]|uniref:Trypsin-like serine protease n=1 Tax=Streptomyces bambusae TaxID=1550616 RepID=A0ABS6Z4X7_9ACTN|nr:serine protease [Streptomyces bambusae]MBW5482777.1 trypsin-like serine protease [Streptomyces bambusae]
MRGGSPVATSPDKVFTEDLAEVAARVRKGLEAEIVESEEELAPAEAAAAQIERAAQEERAKVLEAGARGLEKLAEGRADDVDDDEYFGVEAIVLLQGRPAILVQNQDFPSQSGDWSVLDGQRAGIQQSIARVGRVEVTGHADLDWLGTGFLVAPDVVMTNRHVAAEFSRSDGQGTFTFRQGMGARIDTAEELGAPPSDGTFEFAVTEIIGIHRDVDMALLRVTAGAGGGSLPTPLAIAGEAPPDLVGRPVYVVGYPARDGRRNEPEAMSRIFMDIYNVKRLQPGTTTGFNPDGSMGHDCSTLGGNSGSPVFDLAGHQVLGLHFGGRFRSGNFSVPLFRLTDDPLLGRAEVNFV